MKRIVLISDTHSYAGEDVLKYLDQCDELWHAGDIGDLETANAFQEAVPVFRAVYGNIDGHMLRRTFAEYLSFEIEGLKVLMTHIGGYPGKYSPGVRERLNLEHPGLFISGHSHIAKVMRDPVWDLIHMNPGSCSHYGFHVIRTLLRFKVVEGKISDLELIELGRRGRVNEKIM